MAATRLDAPLFEAILGEHPGQRAAWATQADEVERALLALHEAGRAAWPGVEVEPTELARFVAARLPTGDAPALEITRLPGADLYLACACAAGDPRALAVFERSYFPDIDMAAAAMRAPASVVDEVKQVLRTRFFVASEPGRSAIAEYSGRGDLHGWVRVSAVREVLRLFKKEKRSVDLDDAMLEELAPVLDPEAAAVKARCTSELGDALREALAALPTRERTILRYHVVDGLGVSAIGSIYGVHRATAARWVADVRERVVRDTQRRMAARLRLSHEEVLSMIRLVRSQLDLGIVSMLGRAEDVPREGPAQP
jgi:RNA polymerase sigma-70 factor (ECF subfamily)